MNRRNTIQKELVLNAVRTMHRHVTADEVYEFIKCDHPTIGKGTVYRNLNILAQDGKILKVEVPEGPDCFDFLTIKHYHVRCIVCSNVFDVEMDTLSDIEQHIRDTHGMIFLDHDILFKGICPNCQQKEGKKNG